MLALRSERHLLVLKDANGKSEDLPGAKAPERHGETGSLESDKMLADGKIQRLDGSVPERCLVAHDVPAYSGQPAGLERTRPASASYDHSVVFTHASLYLLYVQLDLLLEIVALRGMMVATVQKSLSGRSWQNCF